MLIANFLMAFFAQSGHEARRRRARRLSRLDSRRRHDDLECFLAPNSRISGAPSAAGILYPRALYEDQGHGLAAEQALTDLLHTIWDDALGFAGVEMHRRILGLAHIAEFEHIADPARRAPCEAKALKLGRYLAINRKSVPSLAEIHAVARRLESGAIA